MKRVNDLFPATVLLAVLAAPFMAGGNGQLGGPTMAGGDLVGTLPSVYVPPGDESDDGHGDVLEPLWKMNGPLGELDTTIKDAFGGGFVTIVGPDDEGDVDLGFHGNFTTLLDRVGLERDSIENSLRVGQRFQGGLGVLSYGGLRGEPFALGSELHIPLSGLLEAGLLEDGALTLHFLNRRGARAKFSLAALGGVVELTQLIE